MPGRGHALEQILNIKLTSTNGHTELAIGTRCIKLMASRPASNFRVTGLRSLTQVSDSAERLICGRLTSPGSDGCPGCGLLAVRCPVPIDSSLFTSSFYSQQQTVVVGRIQSARYERVPATCPYCW